METSTVLEYMCPCCNAGLTFQSGTTQLICPYCDTTFDLETVRAYNEREADQEQAEFIWEDAAHQQWSNADEETVQVFSCPSCGGEILTDETTAATFCPFCDNPTIMPSRLSGGFKPDAVLPFQRNKEDAKKAFLNLCKNKPLLPREFLAQNRIEKITGIYVPFWLYDCSGDYKGSYQATRIHRWSDSQYHYTRTDHFLLRREAQADFAGIPMDGSAKMDDTLMESIEPYDYSQLSSFKMAYLSGFLADKYDVPSESGEPRIRQRVEKSIQDQLQGTMLGYATVVPTSHQLRVCHSKARYVLLPVWMLNTRYHGKLYTFAMNGQTGKMTGSFPICPKRAAAWFAGLTAGITVLATFVQYFL